MKTALPWFLTIVTAIALVAVVAARPEHTAAPAPAKKVLYWVDPMHPAYRSDKPGTAPDCGMDLVPVYEGGFKRKQSIGVKLGVAETRHIARSVRAAGRVTIDETRRYVVTTKFEGYVEQLYVATTGGEVHKGQPLFALYSPDLLAAQQEYLLALRAAKHSPELLEASRRRLQLWDITSREIESLQKNGTIRKSLTIESPAGGVVVSKMAVAGAMLKPGEPAFEIAALDRVWVVAEIYESELPIARVGGAATITVRDRTLNGRIAFIAPTVDPMTRTAQVRIEVDNRDRALKPEMFAGVVIEGAPLTALVVPDSAVLMTGTRSVIFVPREDGSFEPRHVIVGMKSEGYIEITNGVKEGERVVVEANFLIDSESQLKAALGQLGGHDHD